jgi:hypothetical protein
MPWIASVIIGGLLDLMGSLIGRALLALGFGFIEFAGISLLADQVKARLGSAMDSFAGSGFGNLIEWAGFFQIDVHFSILLSAIGVKLLFNGLSGTRVRRIVQK